MVRDRVRVKVKWGSDGFRRGGGGYFQQPGGVMATVSDSRSRGRGFDFQPFHFTVW